MAIRDELIDELLKDYRKPEDIIGEDGLFRELTRRLAERALEAEMTEHLGYKKYASEGKTSGNSRNGHGKKRVKGDFGEIEIEVPRDRECEFEPQLIRKEQRRFDGFDQKIVSLYARGLTTREIQGHLQEIYGIEVSPTLISNVTAEVMEEVKEGQNRPLEAIYPIVYFDAIWVKSRVGWTYSQQGSVPGIRSGHGGSQGTAGSVDSPERRGEILATGDDGVEESRGTGHIHCVCRWTQGVSRGYRDGVSTHRGSALHSSHGTLLPEICGVERTQGRGPGFEVDLLRCDRRTSRTGTSYLRGKVG